MDIASFLSTISLSESDRLLHSWGFDLTKEYLSIATQVNTASSVALELATGTGRMCAVLSALFPTVITGDLSLNDHERARRRIPTSTVNRVQFTQLDMESLPFRTGSIPLLFCLNTLHEVSHPKRCIEEMIRVIHPDGTLVIGDFNRIGFDAMEKIHRIIYKNEHHEGTISMEVVKAKLSGSFSVVNEVPTLLNDTLIASKKI
ncbi:MAG: class I SAM-dependent methyltransferase [Ignavibacteriales bacterium]|nr:class I SAM-dependent methyltransferase [Ignavibacteriales bacterium]